MSESNFAIAVHGGAGPDSELIRTHLTDYKTGIKKAVTAGYKVLESGGSAIDAVEAAVRIMEDDPLFNAGKGAALNEKAEVEMCTSIMDGQKFKCGAAAIVKNVRNPIDLAASIMKNSDQLYLGAEGAKQYAEKMGMRMEPDAYFVTEHAYEDYKNKLAEQDNAKNKMHGTVGAVALDMYGNLAAGTSTGGTECNKVGRIGDSSMIGAGTYANKTWPYLLPVMGNIISFTLPPSISLH
jgi:beta-aspartyl-peptidase (threonine type)